MERTVKKPPKLLVIASYPPKGEKHSKFIVGGAMYAKNTLQAVMHANEVKPEITVLAEAFHGEKASYVEDGLTVKRFWKRGHLSAYWELFKEIRKHRDTKTVVIEFEFAMFGDRLSLLPLPLFLMLLRLMRKRVVFVFHQVVAHIGEMGGHLNLRETGIKTTLMNGFLQGLYASLLFFSNQAVVFEEILKRRLARLGSSKKITVIPFGTETYTDIPSKSEARKKLNLPQDAFIVFNFGFIAWYKGSDWLVKTLAKSEEQRAKGLIKVIIGGGGNPNHMNKPYYVKYINEVKKTAEENGILVTGFIPEVEMPLYYQASDLILLSYRTLMSSSGPLSLAFTFGKPFLLSEPLAPMFLTRDLQNALEATGVKKEDVTFPLTTSFPERLYALSKDAEMLKKLANLSETIAKNRNWPEIGRMYYKVFFKN